MLDFGDSDAAAGPGSQVTSTRAPRTLDHEPPHTAGGGSKASGGDPTTTGRAQEDGNRHLGKLSLQAYYDFDNDGFNFSTEDDEYSFGIRGMEQLDGKVYAQPLPDLRAAASTIRAPGSTWKGISPSPSSTSFHFSRLTTA